MSLNVADLKRRVEEAASYSTGADTEWMVRLPQRDVLALIALAERLKAALMEYEQDQPDYNVIREALAAAKEAGL